MRPNYGTSHFLRVIESIIKLYFSYWLMEFEEEKRSKWSRLKSFIIESKRVYTITKKPSNEEFKVIVKVTALGILLIGLLGFIIHIIAQIL